MTFELEFEDTFDRETLDSTRWIPHYLPHWSSRQRSAARYEIAGGCLRLLITADQRPWCPELDGEIRVSSLQTALFAGPVGSAVGQHRFNPSAVVTEAQLMLGFYEFPGETELERTAADYPKAFVVDYVRGYRSSA